MKTTPRSPLAAVLCAALLATAGCSDDDGGGPPPPTATAQPASTGTATAAPATRTATIAPTSAPTQAATATGTPTSGPATATPAAATPTATGEAVETPTAGEATATPDGPPAAGRIVFSVIDFSTFFADLWVINSDGTGRTNITNSADDSEGQPRWSPDGTKIVFTCNAGICAANADGSGRVVVAAGERLFYPSWSHDGSRIAFTNLRALEVVDADGGNRTVVVPADGEIEVTSPSWSPADDRLAFCSNRIATGGESSLEIYAVGDDGSGLERLTDDQTENAHADWSLADVIAFDSNRGGQAGIYTLDPASGEEQFLLDGSFPAWNADGSSLVYFTFAGLRVANADGSGDQAVPNTSSEDVSPDLD